MKKFPSTRKIIFYLLLLIMLLILVVYVYQININKQHQKASNINLVIISIDTLRSDHMGIYGYGKNTTPNIDKFAKDATVFTNVRTVVPMTYPSFAALMTGKEPIATRITRNYGDLISDNNFTLATVLRENGFQTVAFTTGGLSGPASNLDQGFNEFFYLPYKYRTIENNKTIYHQGNRSDYESFLDKATDWLKANSQKERFFFWVHLMDPHAPYIPPDNFKCLFNSNKCDQLLNQNEDSLEDLRAESQSCQINSLSKDKIEIQETLYDGGVAYTDYLVNKILQTINQEKLDRNSLVVILADHGEGFDHNYYFDHREVLYDSALKIPLIIKDPNGKPNQKIDRLIQNNDIWSTLLDLLKVRYPKNLSAGISFKNAFDNNSIISLSQPGRKTSFFSNSNLTKFAVIEGEFKYIYSSPQSCLLNNQKEELYNLKNDPQELHNLVSDKKDEVDKLKNILLDHLAPYNLPSSLSNQPTKSNSSNNQQQNFEVLPY